MWIKANRPFYSDPGYAAYKHTPCPPPPPSKLKVPLILIFGVNTNHQSVAYKLDTSPRSAFPALGELVAPNLRPHNLFLTSFAIRLITNRDKAPSLLRCISSYTLPTKIAYRSDVR